MEAIVPGLPAAGIDRDQIAALRDESRNAPAYEYAVVRTRRHDGPRRTIGA